MRKIAIIGDSHVYDLIALKNNTAYGFELLKVIPFPGKTAQGLNKDRNIDIYLDKLMSCKEEIEMVGVCLGEIDCATTLWTRQEMHGTSLNDELLYAIQGMRLLAQKLEEELDVEVFFMGPILPLIKDYKAEEIPKIIRTRRDIDVPYGRRIQAAKILNRYLKKECKNRGYKYISINNEIYDEKTGWPKEYFLDPNNRFYHHLKAKDSIRLWSKELKELLS